MGGLIIFITAIFIAIDFKEEYGLLIGMISFPISMILMFLVSVLIMSAFGYVVSLFSKE